MSKTILVVDDDAMNLKMAEFMLKQKGYTIEKATSGEECLEKLQLTTYDLVLLDVEMPGMNGIQTLEKIRETENGKDLLVCFLSADADINTMEAAQRLGAKDYIKKPFLPQDLWDSVEHVLG